MSEWMMSETYEDEMINFKDKIELFLYIQMVNGKGEEKNQHHTIASVKFSAHFNTI